ncbi:MAG: hypothetical protein ACRD29_11450 [Acidimicrobiales bacterium]
MPIQDDRSKRLFGRHASVQIFLAIGALEKQAFTNQDIIRLTGATTDEVSRELKRLADPAVGLLRKEGRQGHYVREDSCFWTFIEQMESE